MFFDLELTEESLESFLAIGQLTEPDVAALRERYLAITDRIESTQGLMAITVEVAEVGVAAALVEHLLLICANSRSTDRSISDIIKSDFESIPDLIEDPVQAKEIRRGIDILQELAVLPAINRTSKAVELIYDCDNIVHNTRVLTDVRPMFSADPTIIEGAVVSHTLRIRFQSAGEAKEMSLAFDDSDLRKLIHDCERALTKADTARHQICEAVKIPTYPGRKKQDDTHSEV